MKVLKTRPIKVEVLPDYLHEEEKRKLSQGVQHQCSGKVLKHHF